MMDRNELRRAGIDMGIITSTLRLVSDSVLPFLHYDIGARAVSVTGFYVVSLAFALALIAMMLTDAIGTSIPLFGMSVAFLGAGGFHLVRTYRRETIRGDYSVESFDYGKSVLYPLWEKLERKVRLPFSISEYRFQMFFEPALVLLIGFTILATTGDILFGVWLSISGMCLALRERLEHEERWNKIRDVIDQTIIGRDLSRVVESMMSPGAAPDTGKRYQSAMARSLVDSLRGDALKDVAGLMRGLDVASMNAFTVPGQEPTHTPDGDTSLQPEAAD